MKKIFLTSIMFLSLFFSCDILEEAPKTVLPPDGYYNTKTGIETLVNACYARLRSFSASTTNLLQLTEQGTDLFEAGVDGDVNFDTYNISLTAGQITKVWEECYIGINACNNVTYFINSVSDMSDSDKKLREAEARFLRAYMYYHLIMQFGDVHLSLEPTVGVQELQLHKYWMRPFIRICVMQWRTCLHNKLIMDVLMCMVLNSFFLMFCYLMKGAEKSSLKKLLN